MTKKHIFLTGFMGSGKTRIGRVLAQKLNKKFVDTDDYIEGKLQKSVKQIFKEEGENYFRECEKESIKELITNKTLLVIALGGGALIETENLEIIKSNGLLIYVEADIEEIWQRTKNKTKRPLLLENGNPIDKSDFMIRSKELFEVRKSGYNEADIKINRKGMEADQVVIEILEKLQEKDY